jgi:two-component system response regulator MprA
MEKSPRASRVLVVSDQEVWVRSLDSTLGPHGFKVRAVPNGQAALADADLLPPDLLVICTTLRDRSGLELCAHLQTSPLIGAGVPVIVITPGPCNRETRIASLRAGAWECYGFPPDPEVLLLKLRVYARAGRCLSETRWQAAEEPSTLC